jgi:hypothetical protein
MKFRKNKKAVSPMIGYILLVSIGVALAVIVYAWLKSYVPTDSLECPDDTSIFIKNYSCDLNNELNITIKNNGKFNVAGCFIRIANVSDQEIAQIDLSSKLKLDFGGMVVGNSIRFNETSSENSLFPEGEFNGVFDISGMGEIYFVELTPIRIEESDGTVRTASCGNAKIREEINC